MSASDDPYATAAELVAAMDSGAVSAAELTEAAIARIERHDRDINAMCVRDDDRARLAARAADTARAHGDRRPLLGVPVTVKESFNVAGLPTTWGIPPFRDFVATEDAVAVARLRAAGAVILGKTNVPLGLGDVQTYNPIYGTTNNPHDLSRTPGGSSGGSAAALAAGFGAVSIGSDLGGSLRVPAHFCGVHGHKSSWGLLPVRGHTAPPGPALAYDGDLAVIGPMARSAADLARVFTLLAGPDETTTGIAYRLSLRPARHDQLAGFRILVLDEHPLAPTCSQVGAAIDDLGSALAAAGATVRRHSPLLPDQATQARVHMRLWLAASGAFFPPELHERAVEAASRLAADDVSLAAERTRGAVLSHRDWVAADGVRTRLRARWSDLFTEFDAVVCPVSATTAFPHDHSPDLSARTVSVDGVAYDYWDQLVWAGVATAPGLPATVAPIARSAGGLPIGVQIVGPMFEDHTPLRLAALIEREVGAGFTPPPLG
nr:amidase [uncultured Actinoplanes sp.]